MFGKTSQKQFIAFYPTDNQIKVGYQVFEKGNLLVNQNSTVLAQNSALPSELEMIFQAKCQEIKESYIATITNTIYEELIEIKTNVNKDLFVCLDLNEDYKISLPRAEVDKAKSFSANAGLDLLYSPIQVLYQNYLDNQSANTLSVLLYDDKFYSLYVANDGQIFYLSESMSRFGDIYNSGFYQDPIKQQKLFDEVYYLEVLSKIANAKSQKNLVVNNINIYYDIKQLSSDDLQNLKNYFLTEINYKKANILDHILELAQATPKTKSFISPRKKRGVISWYVVGSAVASFVVVWAMVLVLNSTSKQNTKEATMQQEVQIINALLPNHKVSNQKLLDEITFLFEAIPENATLSYVVVDNNQSKLGCQLESRRNFYSMMQPKLKAQYKNSKIEFKNWATPYEVEVINTGKLNFADGGVNFVEYKYSKKYDKIAAQALLQTFAPTNWILSFNNESQNNGIHTMFFKQTLVITSLNDFYKFVEYINGINFSIEIGMPISFKKVEAGVELEILIAFHQKA